MHLDTMEAQTASLQASAGGGLRVMMMRRVGVSRRSKGEARLHLEKQKVVRKVLEELILLTSCCGECQRSCEQLFLAQVAPCLVDQLFLLPASSSATSCPTPVARNPAAQKAKSSAHSYKANPPRAARLSFFVEIFETRKTKILQQVQLFPNFSELLDVFCFAKEKYKQNR